MIFRTSQGGICIHPLEGILICPHLLLPGEKSIDSPPLKDDDLFGTFSRWMNGSMWHFLLKIWREFPVSHISFWVVVSNIFYFHPYLGKISILTNICQMGWNHQPVSVFRGVLMPLWNPQKIKHPCGTWTLKKSHPNTYPCCIAKGWDATTSSLGEGWTLWGTWVPMWVGKDNN